MPIRAILFDKDGTLLDFNATFGPASFELFTQLADGDEECLADLAAIAGYDLKARKFLPGSIFVAHASSDYGPMIAERIGVACDDAFLAHMDGLLQSHSMTDATPFADTAETIETLSAAGKTIGCVTNDTQACATAQLKKIGLFDHFISVIGYDSGYGRKPDPDQVLAFSAQAGIPCSEIALVGDALHDIHAANAAGALSIGVTTGLQDGETLSTAADHVVDKLADILPFLDVN